VDGSTVLGDRGFYYVLDANPGTDVDFPTIVLHELSHGLGFYDNIRSSDGSLLGSYPNIFVRQLTRPLVGDLDAISNAQRLAAITSGNLYWKGPSAVAAMGARARMYAPSSYSAGSSVSHWDTSNNPDLLMEPFYTGAAIHNVDLTLQAFDDLGWGISHTGALQVTISPEQAIGAGAQWRGVGSLTWLSSGDTQNDIPVGPFTIEYRDVPGWAKPQNRNVTIEDGQTTTVTAEYLRPLYAADMTADPGWILEGQWAWGQPTGGGGSHGCPDPVSGYTGNNVIGYNLNGDYPNNILATRWATLTGLDCSYYSGVTLSFYRWLGVEQDLYDNAYIEIGNDEGSTWNRVWENDNLTLDSGVWEYCELDISTWADGKENIRIRWGMGPTDTSWTYCGWNIDDVYVAGDYHPPVTIQATDGYAAEQGQEPGVFTVTRTGADVSAQLTVFYTVSGTATNGSDYDTLSGSVTIPAGSPSAPILVTPIDDTDQEDPETVVLTLQAGPGYVIISPDSATVTITDNDAPQIVIEHTPLGDTAEPGPFAVNARITAPGGLDPSELWVYYSVDGGATYERNALLLQGGDWYSGSIPEQALGTVIQYYLSARDLQGGVVTDPADAPASTHSFRVGWPIIEHTPLTDSAGTGPYLANARITAPGGLDPSELWIYYSVDGGVTYERSGLSPQEEDRYSGSVPVQPLGSVVQYYLSARGLLGHVATHPAGAPASTHFFRVGWPMIGHTPLSDATNTGPFDVNAEMMAPFGLARAELFWKTAGQTEWTTETMEFSEGQHWRQVTSAAPWGPRYGLSGHASVVFDGKIWVIGGCGDTSSNSFGYRNDVWYTTDGQNWMQATAAAPWAGREGHTSVVYHDKIWVLGASYGGYEAERDVWYSTNGTDWTQATNAAPWGGRRGFASVVHDDKIWVIGGSRSAYPRGDEYLNDVWYSTDGASWTKTIDQAPWSGRYGHTCVVFQDKIWVMGGSGSGSTDDVWYSDDGVNWMQAAKAAPWARRDRHTSVVSGGKIWVIGGDGLQVDQIWYSADGSNWTQSPVEGFPRIGHTTVVYDDRIWMIGGTTIHYDAYYGHPSAYITEKDVWVNDYARYVSQIPPQDYGTEVEYYIEAEDNSTNIITHPVGAPAGHKFRVIADNDPPPVIQHNPLLDTRNSGPYEVNAKITARQGLARSELSWRVNEQAEWTSITLEQRMEPWIRSTSAAEWPSRYGHTSVVYGDKMWVMGGAGVGETRNDVWYSPNGTSWTQATAAAPWGRRYFHTSVVHDGRIWVIGGWSRDVWYSSNGTSWTLATASAPWFSRYGHTSVVHQGKIWVMGGASRQSVPPYMLRGYADVWYSRDGANWTQATAAAPWGRRHQHTSVVHDGKIWVMGGYRTELGSGVEVPQHDVWYSTDGTSWTQTTAAAPWINRAGHTSVVHDGKIWVMGGYDNHYLELYNDVWNTIDGTNWTLVTAMAPWMNRNFHTSVVYDGTMWIIGGREYGNVSLNDVWETTGEWYTAQIPTQAIGTKVEYYIEAEDHFSSIVTHPADMPPGHQFNVLGELTASIPTMATAPTGAQVVIPVQVQQVSRLSNITSLIIRYDPTILRLPSLDRVAGGDLITDWSIGAEIPFPGTICISAGGLYPVDCFTTGTLFNLQFDVIGDPGTQTDLVFEEGVFRSITGEENPVLSNGSFQVTGPTGDLNVTIQPQGAIDAGAQWRRTGTSKWLNSGEMENGLPTGSYTIEFKPLSAWDTPASQSVEITNGATATASGTYVIKSYTVTFQTDGKPGATLIGPTPQTVGHGANCSPVTANAPAGYHLAKWTKSGGADYSTDNPLTVRNVTEDMTLTAIFTPSKPAAVKDWPLYE